MRNQRDGAPFFKHDGSVPEEILQNTFFLRLDEFHFFKRKFMHALLHEQFDFDVDHPMIGDDDRTQIFTEQYREKPMMTDKHQHQCNEKRDMRQPHVVMDTQARKEEKQNTD